MFFCIRLFIGNAQTCFNFQHIHIKCFTLCTLLDGVVYVETINEKFIIEVIILRQQQEYIFKNSDFICYWSQLFSKQWFFFASDHDHL